MCGIAGFCDFSRDNRTAEWGEVAWRMGETLARRGAPTTLVAADATHVLAGRSALEQFLRCGGEMRVRKELTIAAVAANPWSAYGWHFEPDKFIAALREVIDLPVVNVKED